MPSLTELQVPRSIPGLRPGDLVEVRTSEEILATLDEQGSLDALPFMPEMLQFCGRQFRVFKRSDKTCDTIHYSGSRRMHDTVHLEGARCDGAAHGGCQAGCLTFWKEAWLKPVEASGTRPVPGPIADLVQLSKTTSYRVDGEIRYRCQATDLLKASTPLPWWDIRQYVRDVTSGNVPVIDVVRAASFRLFLKLLRLKGYRFWMALYDRTQSWRGGRTFPYLAGTLDKTPHETLDLQPGEIVEVKSHEEILKTVNKRNRNRGLSFDPEMVRYCGQRLRVRGRVGRLIEEGTGRMLTMANESVILEGAYCHAEFSNKRLFCPRSLFPFWREIWLKRVEQVEGAPQELAHACGALGEAVSKGRP